MNTGKDHLLLSGNSRATAMIVNYNIAWEDGNKIKCSCKYYSLHEYTEAKNSHEVFCNFSIWLMSIKLGVPH